MIPPDSCDSPGLGNEDLVPMIPQAIDAVPGPAGGAALVVVDDGPENMDVEAPSDGDDSDDARWANVNCNTVLIQVFHTFMPNRILMVESLDRTHDGCLLLRYWNHYNLDEVRTGPVVDHGFVYVELWEDRRNVQPNRRESFNIFKLDGWNYIRDPAAYFRALEFIQTFVVEQYQAEGDQGQN